MPRGRQLAGTLPALTSRAGAQNPPFLCSSVHVSKQKSLESRSDGFANSGGDQSSDTVRGGGGEAWALLALLRGHGQVTRFLVLVYDTAN